MRLIEKQVFGILHERFTGSGFSITPDMNLKSDLGFDSLDVVELVLILESEFNIAISDQESDEIDSVQNIIRLIESKARP